MRKFLVLFWLIAWTLSGCGADLENKQTGKPLNDIHEPVRNILPLATVPPQNEIACPNADCVAPRQDSNNNLPIRLSLPTPGKEPVSVWRPPQYPVPLARGKFDHFYFARPIAADVINWPVANYRYGGTELSPGITHTGVDIPANEGTPVLAAGPGVVTWAGWGLFSSSPGNVKDPYGIAIAIRHDFGYHGTNLFTVYAHLSATCVSVGQRVNTGEKIGEVGDTGFTTGAHLHFELRYGKDSYFYTRNPELWLAPPQGWGVLAGRVMSLDKSLATSKVVYIRSLETNQQWMVNTYGPEAVNSDDNYGENMVISDLPAGQYEIKISVSPPKIDITQITVRPGQVSFFVYRDKFGFLSVDPDSNTLPVLTNKH